MIMVSGRKLDEKLALKEKYCIPFKLFKGPFWVVNTAIYNTNENISVVILFFPF